MALERRVISVLALAVAILALFQSPPALYAQQQGVEKPRIAVWDFDMEGLSASEGRAITNRLRSELVNSRRFKVMTRDQIQTLLGEQALGQMLINAKEAIKTGQLSGVNYVVTGTIISLRGAYQLTAEMIDGESAEIIQSITPKTFRGGLLDFIDNEVPRVAQKMLAAMDGGVVIAEKREPPPPPPPPVVVPYQKPPPRRDVVYLKPSWPGTIAGLSLGFAAMVQMAALLTYATAASDADQALIDNDSDAYNEALDDRESAENMQESAYGLALLGIAFVIVDSVLSPTPVTVQGPGARPPPAFALRADPQGIEAAYSIRW